MAAYQRALELIRQTADRRGEIDIPVGLSGCTEGITVRHRRSRPLSRRWPWRGSWAIGPARRAASPTGLYPINGYGQLVETTPDAEEALRLAREIGDPKLLAETLITSAGYSSGARCSTAASCISMRGWNSPGSRMQGLFGPAAFIIGNAYTAKGAYEDALRWYQQLSDYASKAGDTFFIARVPNLIGGVHLELFDLDEALRLNLEGDEVAQRFHPWPEPRGHSLVKAGLAHLYRGSTALPRRASAAPRRCWRQIPGCAGAGT